MYTGYGCTCNRGAAGAIVGCILLLMIAAGSPVFASVEPGDETDAASDTWYHDLCPHWSRPYVLTLWEEGVTNGYVFPIMGPGWDWTYGYDFQPDDPMTRGQVLLMMSRVFNLDPINEVPSPWPDLPPTFSLYGLPAYAEIRAAVESWEIAEPGASLSPMNSLTRVYTVELILAALGLDAYPATLPDAKVDALLAPFDDRAEIAPADRPAIAAAVELGLLIGYEDDTLRIYESLTRAEGATILYRCCLMVVDPAHGRFHPDGDGHRESLPIGAQGLRNASNARWQVQIEDADGHAVRGLPTASGTPGDPHAVTWDGCDDAGDPVDSGRYFVGGWVEDRRGNRSDAVRVPVALVRRSLDAKVEPERGSRSTPRTIGATVRGSPSGVRVQTDDETVRALEREAPAPAWEETTWSLETTPETLGLDAGTHTLTVVADFGPVDRRASITLEVEADDDDPPDPGDPGDGEDGDDDGDDGEEDPGEAALYTSLVR